MSTLPYKSPPTTLMVISTFSNSYTRRYNSQRSSQKKTATIADVVCNLICIHSAPPVKSHKSHRRSILALTFGFIRYIEITWSIHIKNFCDVANPLLSTSLCGRICKLTEKHQTQYILLRQKLHGSYSSSTVLENCMEGKTEHRPQINTGFDFVN